MNAVTPIDAGVAAAWEQAEAAISCWRGQALQCFAQVELAVSEALLELQSARRPGSNVRLRRLIGQRFEDLQTALGSDGPFAEEGARATAALAAFRRHEPVRAFLCHGVAKTVLDKHGQWFVIFRALSLGGRDAGRSTVTYERREAEALLCALRSDGRLLVSALQSLRARVG